MYEIYIGCEEWQDTEKCKTLKEAQEYVEDWRKHGFTMGLYSADEGWIRNDNINYYEEIIEKV